MKFTFTQLEKFANGNASTLIFLSGSKDAVNTAQEGNVIRLVTGDTVVEGEDECQTVIEDWLNDN